MASNTRSRRRSEDEENNNGRPRRMSVKEPTNSLSNVSDITGLRRSARETSSKKMIPSPSSTQKSERFEKRTPPTFSVRRSERVEKQKMPSPLRRSGRTENRIFSNPSSSKSSGSSGSKQKPEKEKSVKKLTSKAKEVSENEEYDVGISTVKIKRLDARGYRDFLNKANKDCHEENNEKLISSKRKGTMVDIHSDVSATLVNNVNCNLITDDGPATQCGSIEGTDSSCFKRIRLDHDPIVSCSGKPCNPSVNESQKTVHHVDGSVERPDCGNEDTTNKCMKVINKVGLPSSICEDGPQCNDVESDKLRKPRDEQRSLLLLLKSKMAKLCRILLLPDNVKSMVDNFLEYIMNNLHVHREPVSILQAFQIALCWTAASFLKHKLDHKASLRLAKQHLNFDCKKGEVDTVYKMLMEIFLDRTGNSNYTGSLKASESLDIVAVSDERNASFNSTSPEEHVHNVIAMCMPNCEHSAQVHEADDSNGSHNAVTQNSPLSDERFADGAMASVLDGEVHEEIHGTVNFTHCPENVTATNPPSSMEQISGGAVNVPLLDRVLSGQCGTASPSNCPDAIALLNQCSLEKQNPDGVSSTIPTGQIPVEVPETSGEGATISLLDREVPLGMPGAVNCTDGGSLSTLDGEIPVLVPEASHEVAGCHNDRENLTDSVLVDKSTASNQQEGVRRTMTEITLSQETSVSGPVEQVQLLSSVESLPDQDTDKEMQNFSQQVELVSSPVDIVPDNDREHLTDSVLVDKGTAPDQRVCRTMTKITLSQETPVSSAVAVMEPLDQVRLLLSVESPPDQDTDREVQNASRQVEPVSCPVDIIPDNQSNLVSLVMEPPDTDREMQNTSQQVEPISSLVDILPDNQSNRVSQVTEPPEQVNQLPSTDFLSHNQDTSNLPLATGIEHQLTNEDALHVPEAAIEGRNQAAAVQPASNFGIDSLMPVGDRTYSLDTRNVSTPSEISHHPIQTATHSASRIVPPLISDPLKHELERLSKLTEQNIKNHEDMKLQLNSDFQKESEELHRKYQLKFQEIEVKFQQIKKNLDTNLNIVLTNKFLADALRSKCTDVNVSGVSGMLQDASSAQQLFLFSRQQSATCPSLVAGPSSCGPPAAGLQSSSTVASSQTTVLPTQAACSTSGIFSGVSARLPHINSISSSSGNLQACGEIRARQPHINSISSPSGNLQASGEIRARQPHINSVSSPSGDLQAGGEIRARQPHVNPISSPSGNLQASGEIQARQPHLNSTSSSSGNLQARGEIRARQPHINSISSPSGNIQAGGQIRAKQPRINSTSSPSGNRQAHGEIRARQPHINPTSSPSGNLQAPTSSPSGNLQALGNIRARQPHINSTSSPSGNLQAGGEIRARRPHMNSISSPSGNLQTGGEMRAPAPHLRPFRPSTSIPASSLRAPALHLRPSRPSTSMPASSLPTVQHGQGTPSQPAPVNMPTASPSVSHCLPRLTPTTNQSDPPGGCHPERAAGLPSSNLTAINFHIDANSKPGTNPPSVLSRNSDMASLNPSRFGTSNSMDDSADQARSSDVVCLSDDD